jgi:hypothetical protein
MPLWRWAGMQPGSVFPIQLGVVLLGATGSLTLMYRISLRDQPVGALLATIPWAALVALLAAGAVWILAQPMEMRGLGFLG